MLDLKKFPPNDPEACKGMTVYTAELAPSMLVCPLEVPAEYQAGLAILFERTVDRCEKYFFFCGA